MMACRSVLVLLLIAGVSSCSRIENHARFENDVPVDIYLDRSFVHARADMPDVLRHAPDCHLDGLGDGDEALAALLVICLYYLAHAGVQYGIDHIPDTSVVVYPEGDRFYKQQLYWGENRVYFPNSADVAAGRYRLLVVVDGDRQYAGYTVLQPDKDQQLQLK